MYICLIESLAEQEMDVGLLLEKLKLDSTYSDQLVHVESLEEREGAYGNPNEPLPREVQQLLTNCGIDELYVHQRDMLELARGKQDAVVVTGTASGKTLCYNLPILEQCWAEPNSSALYLYPTKALAQDQLRGLEDLIGDGAISKRARPGVYDGDTPTARRRQIRAKGNLILSNPDMLHASILPYHPKWARFLSQLRFLVIDEIHSYRGIFGAHVACVLRRLMRICKHYGSSPTVLAASATIANPGEFTTRLIGRDVVVVDQDGSPRGRKFFALWNPLADRYDGSSSSIEDAVHLLTKSVKAGGQSLAFTRTRQAAELVNRFAQEEFADQPDLQRRIRAYRGGYLPNERREIEQQLFNGELRGVAATNALELGVDIGSLDVALLVNYPGTIASLWQQAGRSGRRQDESLAVLIAGNDPIDQYLVRHPQYIFAQSPEHAVVDPHNPYVLANHLRAAAFELPLDTDSRQLFGANTSPLTELLAEEGELTEIDGSYYWSAGVNPAQQVSLRHMSDSTFSIVLMQPGSNDLNEVIANVDAISAPELVYPEAVYLHNGDSYFVRELDLDGQVAYVERHEMDYYTQAVLDSSVRILETRTSRELIDDAGQSLGMAHFGDVEVRWKTVAFKKIKFSTRENIGFGTVDIPDQTLDTTACWFVPSDGVRAGLKEASHRVSEAMCGVRNLGIVALPMVAMCDARDISGIVDSKNLGTNCCLLYDRYPGGLGYCEKGYQQLETLLAICLQLVSECDCDDGCPSCVGLPNLRPAIHSDPDLSRGYPIPNKAATLDLLMRMSRGIETQAQSIQAQSIQTQSIQARSIQARSASE